MRSHSCRKSMKWVCYVWLCATHEGILMVFILIAIPLKKCNSIILRTLNEKDRAMNLVFISSSYDSCIVRFLNRFISFDMSQLLFLSLLPFFMCFFSFYFFRFYFVVSWCSSLHLITSFDVVQYNCSCAWTFVQPFNLNYTWLRSWSFIQDFPTYFFFS